MLMQRIHLLTLPLLAAVALAVLLLLAGRGPGSTIAADGDAAGAAAIKGLSGCTNETFAANDDGSTAQVALPFSMNFFGTTYNALYVNNNGNVTFETPLGTYTPFGLVGTETVIIAPFFADVDTRGPGSGLTQYGATTFGGRPAFCVNWVNVGYFNSRVDKLNSFQLLLVERTDQGVGDFDIIFNYNQVQWETGGASGGTDGLGGTSATVGYSNGSTTSLELPGSRVPGSFIDTGTSPLTAGSRGSSVTGRYIFAVRNGVAPTGGSISGTIISNKSGSDVGLAGSLVQACFAATPAPPCQVTTTNANGDYVVTGLQGGGNYFVTAFPPRGVINVGPRTIGALFMPPTGADLVDQDIKLIPSRPAPPGVTIETPYRAGDGTPAVSSTTGAGFRQTGACTGGSATWSISQGGVVLASGTMTETAPGKYKGTIPPLPGRNGRAVMNITINCPGAGDKNDDFDIYIDPSGTVVNQSGTPIAGATVTLYRSDSSAGPFEVVPDGSALMSPSNRTNPGTTGPDGIFRWDVMAGYYRVRASAPGCVNPGTPSQAFVETAVLEIPPPALDLELRLQCGGGPPPPTPTRTPPGPAAGSGDASCDGQVNAIDAAFVLQFSAVLLDELPCEDAADVNQDGTVNAIDASIVLQFSAGLIDELPV